MAAAMRHEDDEETARQEVVIKFAQKLAANEKKFRDRAIKKLRKWMEVRSHAEKGGFTEDEMVKIWKGLHYCMWMCDKPLVQEELSERIAQLVHCFRHLDAAFLFLQTFFETQCREWQTIDHLRLDKFMRMIRQVLCQGFVLLRVHGWTEAHVARLLSILTKQIINSKDGTAPSGVKYHIADVYIEELVKAGGDKLSAEQVHSLLEPYVVLLPKADCTSLRDHVIDSVFGTIISQAIEDAQTVSQSEDEDDPTPPSPRLQCDFQVLADRLFTVGSSKKCLSRNRRPIYDLVKRFKDLAAGILPVEEVEDESFREDISKADIASAVSRLQKLDYKMMRKPKKKKRKMEKEPSDDVQEPETKKKKKNADASSADIKENEHVHMNGVLDEAPPTSKKITEQAKKGKNKYKTDEDESGKKNKSKKNEKKVKSKNDRSAVDVVNSDQGFLFEGGFFDDEDELDFTDIKPSSGLKINKEVEAVEIGEDNCVENDVVTMETGKNVKKKKKRKSEASEIQEVGNIAEDSSSSSNLHRTQLSETPSVDEMNHEAKTLDMTSVSTKSASQGNELLSKSNNGISVSKKKQKTKRQSMALAPSSEESLKVDNVTIETETPTSTVNSHHNVTVDDSLDTNTPKSSKKTSKASIKSKADNVLDTHTLSAYIDNSSSTDSVEVSKTKKTKNRRKSTGDIASDATTSLVPTKVKKDKKRKSLSAFEMCASGIDVKENKMADSNKLEEGEVEIWVPNKKYKGNKKSSSAVEICDASPVQNSPPVSPFAVFDQALSTPPPAFVKKSIAKATPKTEPRKLKSTPGGNRRVSFNLQKNRAQEFRESLTLSPAPPFNPLVIPDQGILKTPPTVPKIKVKRRRASAVDFF